MKIGLIFYDMQEFGGLEEYAVALAIAHKERGHQVNVLSTSWIPTDNQYLIRLHENRIRVIQPPRWISLPASDWPAKERLISSSLRLLTPIAYMLGIGLALAKRRPWREAVASARSWLQGRLGRIISPDRRKPITRFLLAIWSRLWRPDILHLQGYTTNLLFVIEWAHSRKLPVAYEEHQTPDPMFDWWRDFSQSVNKSSIVVAVSEKSAQALRDVCGVKRPISVRNPLVVDPVAVHSDNKNGLHREGPFTVSTIARLYETKGLNFLLEAAVMVRRNHADTIFKVHGDGPLRDELLQYAADLGLDGSSIFVGAFNHNDLPAVMAQTDIFLLPSILEGQPLVLAEALAYGCPIVSTSVGGIPELIRDGVNGILCPPADPASLAEGVCKLIENPELRACMGQAARQSYESGPFQPEAVSKDLETIYNKAIQMKADT